MTDWDAGFDGADITPKRGLASMAFIGLACAVVWVITVPFEIAARIRDAQSSRNPLNQSEDCGAIEGGVQQYHSHSTTSGAQRDHG